MDTQNKASKRRRVITRIGPRIDLEEGKKWISGGRANATIQGITFKVNSKRLRTFNKSCNCVKCGAVGQFFRVEKNGNFAWHLNLYAIRKSGKLVMMTSDHIIPKSEGGPNAQWNRQPMCKPCNENKGSNICRFERIVAYTYRAITHLSDSRALFQRIIVE